MESKSKWKGQVPKNENPPTPPPKSMNIGEDNSTTSGNGQDLGYTDSAGFHPPVVSKTEIVRKKIRTRSYKTELGKMKIQRNKWIALAVVELLYILRLLIFN